MPDTCVQTNTYNKTGLLETVAKDSVLFVTNINYNEKGQREAIYYGNNTKTKYEYDTQTFRLKRLLTTRNNGIDILQDISYIYDPVGNIVEMNDLAQQTHYFSNSVIEPKGQNEYDALYRLTKATGRELASLQLPTHEDFPNNIAVPNAASNAMQNYTQQYQYDQLGNILQMKSVGNWTRDYFYNTNDNKLLGHTNGATEYTYDAHGNITSMPHLTSMNWDYKNQLLGATNGTFSSHYVYDATGNRTRKVVVKGNITEERYYLGNYEVYRKTNNGTLEIERSTVFLSDDKKKIAQIDNDDTTETIRYQYDNHLGSASLELDENAAIISYEEYHPFGTTSYRSGRSETEVSRKRYKYVGKERDEETGLYYYGARHYAGWIARFISTDPVKAERTWVTPYNYCQNNPINRIDPTGALDGEPPYKGANPELFVEDSTALKSNNGQKLKENPYEVNKRGGLTLAGDISMALDDIRSIVPDKYKSRIKADEKNKISFNVENLTSDDINSDAGLRLLFDIIHKSAYDYKYEVSEKTVGMHRVTGKEVSYDLKAVYGISNLSITPRMKYFDRSFKPVGNFSGHVTIHPNALFFEKIDGTEFQKHRADVVFHELQENFERTDNKLPYIYQDPKNISREDPLKKDLGAHGVAIKKAFYLNDKIKSRKPGEGTTKYK